MHDFLLVGNVKVIWRQKIVHYYVNLFRVYRIIYKPDDSVGTEGNWCHPFDMLGCIFSRSV